MASKLMPCPFCQGPAEELEDKKGWFSCSDNECPAWHVQALAEEWNRRATQPAAGEPVAHIDVNAIADHVADNWPMRKYALGEIEAGLRSIRLEVAPPAAAPVAAGEPVLWQVRHCDPHRGWDEWTDVLPRSPALGETVADRVREYQDYIAHGGRYELRALGIVAPPAAAHGDDAVLWELIDKSVYGSDEQQVVARAKIRRLLAMRAQGDGGEE